MKKLIWLLVLSYSLNVFSNSNFLNPSNWVKNYPSTSDVDGYWLNYSKRLAPAISYSIPTGFSGSSWDFFANFSSVSRVRYDDFTDGSMTVGLGFGDPSRFIGGSIAYTIFDVFGNNPGKYGSVHLNLSKMLTNSFSLAVGVNNLIRVNTTSFQIPSYYLSGTKIFSLSSGDYFQNLTLTLGVGNGSFNNETRSNQILAGLQENSELYGVFAGTSLGVTNWANAIVNYTGQDLDAGFSVTPFKKLGIVGTAMALDLTDSAGDGVRFGFSLGYVTKL